MTKCEIYSTARQIIDYNTEHTHCMLYNTYCHSTAKMVSRTRLNVMLYCTYIACLIFIFRYVTRGNQCDFEGIFKVHLVVTLHNKQLKFA
jgi:hypothetical protein